VNLDELRTVQMKERKKDSLQHLRDSFYGDVATYIEDLKAQRSRAAEQADDPFSSPEVSRLTDEIETAEEVAEAVYERRVGKVVKLASFAAADMSVDEEGMTAEERRLFDDLVARIEQNKTAVLDTLAGKHVESTGSDEAATSPASEPTPADSAAPSGADRGTAQDATDGRAPAADTDSPESGGMLADAMGGDDQSSESAEMGGDDQSSESAEAGAAGEATDGRPVPPEEPPADGAASDGGTVTADPGHDDAGTVGADSGHDDAGSVTAEVGGPATTDDTDRTTVRITRDVGAIFGVDEREYDLSTEDVVTLPAANADPLLEQDAAERID
jgi:DNA replication factor GINS